MRRKVFRMSEAAYHDKLKGRNQTVDGLEIPSAVPMAPPIGFIKQPSLVEQMRAMVRSELLKREVEAAGAESFEEADDFEVADDLEPLSGYENDPQFEPPVPSSPEPPGSKGDGEKVPTEPPKAAPTEGKPANGQAGGPPVEGDRRPTSAV